MLNDINLLPIWYKNKLGLESFLKKTFLVLAVVFIIPAAVFFYAVKKINTAESELYAVEMQLADDKYDPSDRIYHELTEKIKLAEFSENAIVQSNSTDLIECLEKIFAAMPDGIHAVELDYADVSSRFIFTGGTRDTGTIPLFIDNLGKFFDSVSFTRLNNSAGDGLSSFTLEFYAGESGNGY